MGLVVVMSCQDSSPGGRSPLAPSQDASFLISDGRVTGGNPETFWGTPLAQNAQAGDLNYDVGASHALLRPYLRVCELALNTEPPLGVCPTDVTQLVTGSASGLLMTYNSGNENYTVGLQTKQLNKAKNYRLEVWGVEFITAAERAALDPRWLFTVRDIGNAPSVSACVVTQAFCLIKYGQSVPVKVRLEQFVFCPVDKNCGMQFVSTGSDATLQATLNTSISALTSGPPATAQFHIPAQAGTNFALAFEPCTAAQDLQVSDLFDIKTGGPCLKTVSKNTGTLGTPAIVSFCDANNAPPDLTSYGFAPSQAAQVVLHHVSSDLTRIQALPEAWNCVAPTSGEVASATGTGLLYYARALGDRLFSWAAPKPLFASSTMMIDRGGGGADPFLGSYFKFALPAKFVYVDPADASQTANTGDAVPVRAKAVDFFNAPIQGVRVRWLAVPLSFNDGATVVGSIPLGPVLTGADGIALNTATLFADYRGTNVFYAYGRGIADDRATGCIIPPSTTSTCNGPRATYDPFLPLHSEFGDTGAEVPVELPTGTRLRFSIFARGSSPP
jgi:hypothetical protein